VPWDWISFWHVKQLMGLTLKLTSWQNFEFCATELWDHLLCIINIFPYINFSLFFTPFSHTLILIISHY
jgi:hypothetical protein